MLVMSPLMSSLEINFREVDVVESRSQVKTENHSCASFRSSPTIFLPFLAFLSFGCFGRRKCYVVIQRQSVFTSAGIESMELANYLIVIEVSI